MSLWDLNYYVDLKELKCAIYDGLEMKLKVTKNVCPGQLHSLYGVMVMMNDLSGFPVSCVFFDFQCRVLKGVKKFTKTVLQCAVCSFPLPNGLERSPFTECDI